MKKNKIDITILMDCSGSMETIKDDMEGAINAAMEEQKANDDCVVSLYTFSGTMREYKEKFVAMPIKDVPRIKLNPTNSTALYDAVCMTIDKVGQRLAAMREEDRPDEVFFAIVTDGQENASREYSASEVRERVERQENQYSWKFMYFGANQIAKEVANEQLNIRAGRSMSYTPNAVGTVAMAKAWFFALNDIRLQNWDAKDVQQEDVIEK